MLDRGEVTSMAGWRDGVGVAGSHHSNHGPAAARTGDSGVGAPSAAGGGGRGPCDDARDASRVESGEAGRAAAAVALNLREPSWGSCSTGLSPCRYTSGKCLKTAAATAGTSS